MIIISDIVKEFLGDNLKLCSKIRIDNEVFELYVKIVGQKWHQYVVTDRLDAFLWGILPYAMRHGQDIKCEGKISGKLLYNLNTQYIQTLAKYDDNLYASKIEAEIIDEDIVTEGAVATGVSCGVDCLYTIVENYNSKYSKDISLTHLFNFNEGAFGGSYYSANRDFVVKRLHAKEQALADELNLPVVNVSTNLESLLRIPIDQFIVYAMGLMVMSLGKLVGTYLYSSSGGDYGDFSVKETSKKDISYADLLSLHCISHGSLFFYSSGGAKSRFEKFKYIADSSLTKKHLFSCLNQDFNCGVCVKCLRNLLTIDALGLLEEYRDVYDIEDYKKNRQHALEYMVNEVCYKGYSYSYLKDIYTCIKHREPETIEKLEKNLSSSNLLFSKDKFQKMAEDRLRAIRAYKTLCNEKEFEKIKDYFERNGYKHVILYYYSYATDILVTYAYKLGIVIDYIVEDVSDSRSIPRLPYNTVDYPNCDVIINCNIRYINLSHRKLLERTNNKIIDVTEILDLRETLW